jgi:hypothetical protein
MTDDLAPIHLSALTGADLEDRCARVARVRELAAGHLGREMHGDMSDLDIIQGLLDRGIVDDDDLESLGLVLGMCLARAIEGLAWVVVDDQYGRTVALQYEKTTLLAYPLTMIAKRILTGKALDVRDMFEFLVDQIEVVREDVDPAPP